MKKVLAFFGAFNPPTKAHVELAKFAMEKAKREGVVFIPSKTDYILNEQKKGFAFSNSVRLNMLCCLCETNHWMNVSNHDIFSETQPRTYETLKYLRDIDYYEPTLLVGADQFAAMEINWKHVPEIAKEFGIVVLTRSFYDFNINSPFYQSIAPYVQIIQGPSEYGAMSSTLARNEFQEVQEHIGELQRVLPKEVYGYLKEQYI